jgi:Na+/proline symporter
MGISSIDFAAIIIYLAGIVCLGIWAGFRIRKGGERSHYFLA